jgi:NADPH:quinone reductase-like Zn-dependent oxidoreductase
LEYAANKWCQQKEKDPYLWSIKWGRNGNHPTCKGAWCNSDNSKHDFAKKLGAHYIIDRTRQDIAGEVKKIVPAGVDIVIDHVGAATWATSIAALRQGGRMAVCGMTSGNEATVPVRMFYTKQIVMVGSLLGTRAQLQGLINFIIRKKIQPVIDSVFPLHDAREAQKKMEAGVHAGKILLKL